ncbi:hypothetical protein LOD99_14260 [Oopsacas minuta]|uniref:Uncharacterized protein n=1 Tax=Oopsacas minuta TaxID=111878 RepID=A0AAV7KGX4_9METZ|nr:hypothetical protein LOD99_14260 [Oopsacas minuta]
MRKLHVDILNYSDDFFSFRNWNLTTASKKVERFISAARKSGWILKVFIDAVIESDEALKKWRKRREKELSKCMKNMPQGTSTLIGDLFRIHGVEVAYSVDKDNDDTMAFHACTDGADVLSRDMDFFRYLGATYKVYKSFYINKQGQLILQKHPGLPPGGQGRVPISRPIQTPPRTCNVNPLFALPGFYLYRRGVPSPLVSTLGNPHVMARPLREALYSRKGIRDFVVEEFPVWDSVDNKPCWENTKVYPNDKLDYLLDSPRRALLGVYKCKDWPPRKPKQVSRPDFDKHLFAMKCVVFEICSHASGECLANLMLRF